jgi:hypothetical protein
VQVLLAELCTVAAAPVVDSVACVFGRNITYTLTAGPARSGNYFEVTVLNVGDKCTIGVGLADPVLFPSTKHMPG